MEGHLGCVGIMDGFIFDKFSWGWLVLWMFFDWFPCLLDVLLTSGFCIWCAGTQIWSRRITLTTITWATCCVTTSKTWAMSRPLLQRSVFFQIVFIWQCAMTQLVILEYCTDSYQECLSNVQILTKNVFFRFCHEVPTVNGNRNQYIYLYHLSLSLPPSSSPAASPPPPSLCC